jgi:hypothetical protein
MPEFIDLVFGKTSPKRLFLVIENKRFGLVFVKTGSINLGTGLNDQEPRINMYMINIITHFTVFSIHLLAYLS